MNMACHRGHGGHQSHAWLWCAVLHSTCVGATEGCLKEGCIATLALSQRQKRLQEGAHLIAHDRTDSRVAIFCRMAWVAALQTAVWRRAALPR